jgi:hypothetical protein
MIHLKVNCIFNLAKNRHFSPLNSQKRSYLAIEIISYAIIFLKIPEVPNTNSFIPLSN